MKLKLSYFGIAGLALFVSLFWFFPSSENNQRNISLFPPAFMFAQAQGSSAPESLIQSAGISAYYSAGMTINLNGNLLRNQFRTIESETSEFLIGSIAVPGYGESEDVKVYISVEGWVMVYYLHTEPVSKIFDWNGTTTRLEIILNQLADVLGVVNPEIQFYDFRYPNATHILLVGETRQSPAGTDTFDITYPSDYTLYETSWYLRQQVLPGLNIFWMVR